MDADFSLASLTASRFFLVFDVDEMYVALLCTSVPCMEQRGRPTLSDSDRYVNSARVSVRQLWVSNLKNQIFCHLRIYYYLVFTLVVRLRR